MDEPQRSLSEAKKHWVVISAVAIIGKYRNEKARLIKGSDISFTLRGDPPGHAEVGWAISNDISSSFYAVYPGNWKEMLKG